MKKKIKKRKLRKRQSPYKKAIDEAVRQALNDIIMPLIFPKKVLVADSIMVGPCDDETCPCVHIQLLNVRKKPIAEITMVPEVVAMFARNIQNTMDSINERTKPVVRPTQVDEALTPAAS